MGPKEFVYAGIVAAAQTEPRLKQELKDARMRVRDIEEKDAVNRRFLWWHRMLRNGETPAGMFGANAAYAWFVRGYRLGPPEDPGVFGDLREVDLLLVPDMLVPHQLVVGRPSGKPGTTTMSAQTLEVQDIVNRIMRSAKGASKNVRVSSFDEALCEPCPVCAAQAVMVAMDEYLDDDNGHRFTLARLCIACHRVDDVAAHHGYRDERDQYAVTDAMYRK